MIGIHDKDGTLLPITINGLTFNAVDMEAEDKLEVVDIRYQTSINSVIEPRNDGRDGVESPVPNKNGKVIRFDGVLSAPNIRAFYDKVENLASRLDPVLLARNNPSTEGFVEMLFTTPSEPQNKPCFYKVRPFRITEPIITSRLGTIQAPFTAYFMLKDERRYLQEDKTLSGAGTATNDGDYPTWPVLTVTMSGAGHASFQASNSTTGQTLQLNLSGLIASDIVTIRMESREALVNGTATPSIVSTTSDWWDLSAGANTIAYVNTTGQTSRVLAWNGAYAL